MLIGLAAPSHAVSAPSSMREVARVVLGHLVWSRHHRTRQGSQLWPPNVRVTMHLGVNIARIGA
eukprot:4331423-Pyramimonas_sp.AAC.1